MVDVYQYWTDRSCCSIVRIQLRVLRYKPWDKKERSEYLLSLISYLLSPNGGVAQLGEHLPCKQGVKGSNPFISTIKDKTLRDGRTEKPERKTGL